VSIVILDRWMLMPDQFIRVEVIWSEDGKDSGDGLIASAFVNGLRLQ
jgi:hypothetical protein